MSQIPEVPIRKSRRILTDGLSLIWLIPLAALVVAFAVAWQSYANQGRVIVVEFRNGAGLIANSTELRYRDISVGIVERIGLSDGLEGVQVDIRLNKDISAYVDQTSQFWVVRPELTTQGVSGLETVLSGVFIEGDWDGEIGPQESRFQGLEKPPLFRPDEPGLQISIRSSPRGYLVDDSPILFRGIEVGKVGQAAIDPRGNYAVAEAIIYEPYDRLITTQTRFWDASGFSISVGASGATIDFSSLASLLAGGVTFDTFVSGGRRVPDGTLFQVYDNESNARSSIFNQSEVEELTVTAIFSDNIAGLTVDAPVELAGLRIGTVSSVNGIIDPDRFGDSRVRLNAVLAIQPTRLGLQEDVSADGALAFLRQEADNGLRARLATASLLSGGLKVELVTVEGAPPDPISETAEGLAIFPTTESQISDASATAEGVLNRITALPIESLMQSAIDFLDSARNLVSDEELRETPADLRALLAEVRGVVASDDVQAVAGNLNAVLTQLETLLSELETEKAVQRLTAAVDAAAMAAEGLDASVTGVPDLIAELTAVAEKARALPLEELTTRVAGLVDTADKLVQTEGVQDLPVQLSAALAEVNATLQELREGGAVTNVNAALASARDAADAVAASTTDLPELAKRLAEVLDQASRTIQGFDKGETISRDVQAALRDIQKAADALASLARTLERNPSSLIRGRN